MLKRAIIGLLGCLPLATGSLTPAVSAAGYTAAFVETASVSPNPVAPGTQATITATFKSTIGVSNVVTDVEVRDSANNKVFQQLLPAQNFSAGQTATVTPIWSVPANQAVGTYTVKMGVFSSDYLTGYGWNDGAAVFTVGTSSGTTGTRYYVDCSGGNDASVGTDASHAWRSLARANQAKLQPGEGLLLKRGCAWTGPLLATWTGTAAKPIQVQPYGSGALPLIQNANPFQVRVTGSYIVFDSLSVRSDPDSIDATCNNNRIGYRVGFEFDTGSAYNVVQNSVISDLGAGIDVSTGSHHNNIRRNDFAHNNMMFSADQFANDGGGTALVMNGDNNDIGYNTIHDNVACSSRYGVIGHVFDVEMGTANVFHHNRSWNVSSNFGELGGYNKATQANNTIFAYNIVINNGITTHDNAHGTKLYNNVFYNPSAGIVNCEGCGPTSMTLRNNILFAGTGIEAHGAALDEAYDIFWNPPGWLYNTYPISSTSKFVDPLFVNAAGGDFHLQTNSPAINAGRMDAVNIGFVLDFDGKSVPQGGAVDIGAYEMR